MKNHLSALAGVTLLLAAALPQISVAAEGYHIESRDLAVKHIVVTTPKHFADVCSFIESSLGRFDEPMHEMLKNGQTEQLRASAKKIIQNYGLSIHYISNHGALLKLNGPKGQITGYYIGDLISASTMTRSVPAAGLYAPLRVIVYANSDGGTTIEYDQPSMLFGQFGNQVTTDMGASLDERMSHFLHDAAN